MKAFDYDLMVIGGGAAGLTAAKFASKLNKKVVIIEKNRLGGQCTWTGCVPSKAFIKAAEVAHAVNTMHMYGLKTDTTVNLNAQDVFNHVRSIIHSIYKTQTPDVLERYGVHVKSAGAIFIDNHHVQAGDKTLSAEKIIIATGSIPAIPEIAGLDKVPYLTNVTLFALQKLPQSIAIIGAGPIGVEMASAFNRLGVSVTLIEMSDRVLPEEDIELAIMLTEYMRQEGVRVILNTRVRQVQYADNTFTLACDSLDGKSSIVYVEQLLIATGRKANCEGMYLNRAKVVCKNNAIEVDHFLRTAAPNIYACGDVVGPYMFSHMAHYQATIATRNALIPFFKKKVDYSNVSWVIFASPEYAVSGLTEENARKQYGDTIRVYHYKYSQLDKSHMLGQLEGMGKFICDKSGRLIGAHILGPRAGELIGEIQVGKTNALKFKNFYHALHPYPTYSQLIWYAARNQYIDWLSRNIFVRCLQKIWAVFPKKK